MNRYFYLIHPFLQHAVSLQVPVYIGSPNQELANSNAVSLCSAFSTQFDLLFAPSDPVLVIQSINEARFDGLISQLSDCNNKCVLVNLPLNHGLTLYQHAPYQQSLETLQARVLVPGQHSIIYSL